MKTKTITTMSGLVLIDHKSPAPKEASDKIKCHFCGAISEYDTWSYISIASGQDKYMNDDFTQNSVSCSDCLPKLRIVLKEEEGS